MEETEARLKLLEIGINDKSVEITNLNLIIESLENLIPELEQKAETKKKELNNELLAVKSLIESKTEELDEIMKKIEVFHRELVKKKKESVAIDNDIAKRKEAIEEREEELRIIAKEHNEFAAILNRVDRDWETLQSSS